MYKYLVAVIHIKSDEVVKMAKVKDINSAAKLRDDYELAFNDNYEVIISDIQ